MTRRNPTRRRTIRNALARTRGARTASVDARVRHHLRDDVALLIRAAIQALNDAERWLLDARQRLETPERRRERRAA